MTISSTTVKNSYSGDGPGALDPLKEAMAAAKRMEEGITTRAEEVGAVFSDRVPLLAGLGCVKRPGEREAGARIAVFRPLPLCVSLDPLRHALEGGREALAERRPQEPLLYRFDGPVVDLDAEVGHRVTSCACAVPLLRPPGDGGQPG